MRIEAVSEDMDLTLPIWDDLATLDWKDPDSMRAFLEMIEIAQLAGEAIEKARASTRLEEPRPDGAGGVAPGSDAAPDGPPELPEILS